ncbi:TPA: DNA cytosine methyltransferase [Streptococcus pneumoniae]|nr:DNA cytosine methyltransferase [Streptococcus pneumoniae]HEU3946900.1 DNA cytosine methyltransferase [Streptococcus pneumoniae]HEU4049053.1 DNA cytosine methyltransferase [Streptococcus pneumoniae]
MKFLDLFAGIGGFRLGMESAGHKCIGFCEIDKFARESYKAIHDTKGEIELHDITAVSDESIRGIGSVDISYHENNHLSDGFRIRKLTPRECWRLQGFPDWAFDKAQEVNSNSQLYKQAGNSVTVNVIAAIAKELS